MFRRATMLSVQGWHGHHYVNFYSPATEIPYEYTMRLEPQVVPELTRLKDPNSRWGLNNYERGLGCPQAMGHKRNSHLLDTLFESKCGAVCEVPPIPVYREHIWCQGAASFGGRHPRIFIKTMRGRVVPCKWCRLKYINMSTDDDTDENWRQLCDAIGKRRETKEQAMRPHRTIWGVSFDTPYPNGPHPEVYRTWINDDVEEPEKLPEKGAADADTPPPPPPEPTTA